MKSNWKIFQLKDLISIKHGYAFKGEYFTDTNTTKILVTPGNFMIGGGFKATKLKFYDGPIPDDYILKKDDLIVTMTDLSKQADTLGYSALIPSMDNLTFLHNQRIGLIDLESEEIDKYFLYFLLRSKDYRHHVVSSATGSTVKHTSPSKILSFKANIPPKDIQIKISNTLLMLDYKIQINQQINQTLEAMAQALFKSWFVDFEPVKAKIAAKAAGADAEGVTLAAIETISGQNAEALGKLAQTEPERYAELKATAELFPDALVESELGETPKYWNVKVIDEIADVIKGRSYKSSELAESNVALVTLKSFKRGGGYRLDGLKSYTGKYKENQEVVKGDLIIAYTDVTQAADVIGKPAMVISDSNFERLVISLDVGVVRPFDLNLKNYLYCEAMTERFQRHTRSYTKGTTVLHLAKNAVPDYKLLIPGEQLINLFNSFVQPIYFKVDQLIQENYLLESLRDTLLPKLISGEVSVEDV